MVIASIVIACVACAILGRMGGAQGYNTKFRDIGIPLVACSLLMIHGLYSWWMILSFGLMFAALTTYWDFIFGYDNYWFHGFMVGLSLVPVAGASGDWISLLPAIVLTSVWMGGWSSLIRVAVVEELVRYAVVPLAVYMVR